MSTQIIVAITVIDSEDFEFETKVIPCDTMKTAKAVVKRLLGYTVKFVKEAGYCEEQLEELQSCIKMDMDGNVHADLKGFGKFSITITQATIETLDSVKRIGFKDL